VTLAQARLARLSEIGSPKRDLMQRQGMSF